MSAAPPAALPQARWRAPAGGLLGALTPLLVIAIAAMALAGERKIVEIVVVGDGEDLCTPCGGCRQRIREFADAATRIHVAGRDRVRASFALEDLLPHSFGPGRLGR